MNKTLFKCCILLNFFMWIDCNCKVVYKMQTNFCGTDTIYAT